MLTRGRAIAYGALTVGALDILDAFVFFGRRGVRPVRILQSIASGLLGRGAFAGGFSSALLGLVLHFTIATIIVSIYMAASRKLDVLVRHPLVFGPLYGIVAYVVMSRVVVPLSAAVHSPPTLPVVLNGLFIHVVGVGTPSALFARAAHQDRT